jgi:hypothetical protein
MPSHNHGGTTDNGGNKIPIRGGSGNYALSDANINGDWDNTKADLMNQFIHNHTFTTNATGGNKSIDIRPNYYSLAYIMKLAN